MALPTRGELYMQLIEHIRKAQETSAMMAHMTRDEDKLQAQGWLAVSEMFKQVNHNVTELATKGMIRQ